MAHCQMLAAAAALAQASRADVKLTVCQEESGSETSLSAASNLCNTNTDT